MPVKYKTTFMGLIIAYGLAYLLAFGLALDIMLILLKPGATLLAWVSVRFFTPLQPENQSVKKLVRAAFFSWFIADLIALVGELIILVGGHDPFYFYNLEIVLYAVSRILILLTIAGLYRFVTKKTSRFQVIADMITLFVCIVVTIWMIFFKKSIGNVGPLLSAGDLITTFALIYITISLMIQGLLLLNWLYFKERSITIGHKTGLTGMFIITMTDLMTAIYPSLLYQGDNIDIAYKAGILLVAMGGVYFDQLSASQLRRQKFQRTGETWKNGFYFLAYPLFAFYIVGFDPDLLIYSLIIAFYIVCCLYTRQIDLTNEALKKEKAVNKDLKNQHYFTMQLLDAMSSGIFYATPDDVLLGMNARLRNHYGLAEMAVQNIHLADFPAMSAKDFRQYQQMKEVVLATGKPCIRQAPFINPQGHERVALYSISSYNLADGELGGFLGLFTDITELKEKEKDLEVALKKANAATEAKSLFLANMSHEIRTPMNAIIGMSHLALQTTLDGQQQDYVLKIHGAATSLLGIINDILDFSKIESGRFELELVDFNLPKLVKDVVLLFEDKASQKNLSIIVDLPEDLPLLFRGDPMRLGQVLTNLLSNAIKFTKTGVVSLVIQSGDGHNGRMQLEFFVRDTGIGINPQNLERLFEPFTQSDSSTTRHYGGTGLGLTISRDLVEMMGGRLVASSTVGAGSTFSFSIWLEKSQLQQEDVDIFAQPNKKLPASLTGLTILLVEDNAVNRQIAEEFLKLAGAQVEVVENGAEALNCVIEQEGGRDYDLILMDIQMPVMDGFEATRKIRIINRDIPILAMTARTMVDEQKECIRNGMNDHIAKPIEPQLLYRTILKYINPRDRKRGQETGTGIKNSIKMSINKEMPQFIFEIAGIDWTQLVMRIGNSPELLKNLLEVFSENHGQMAVDIKKALADGDHETLKKRLHTAKGVLGNIDASKLYEQICQIEAYLLDQGQDEILNQWVTGFCDDFEKFYNNIQTVLLAENQKQGKLEKDNKSQDRQVKVEAIIKLLRALLEEGDSEALDYFDENRLSIAGVFKPATMIKLVRLIHGYDFDGAAALLEMAGKE